MPKAYDVGGGMSAGVLEINPLDGRPVETPVANVVPGDLVLLSAGDMIPADGLVLEAHDLFVKQALLTGEPYPVEKRPGPLMDWMLPLETPIDRPSANSSSGRTSSTVIDPSRIRWNSSSRGTGSSLSRSLK